MRDVTKVRRWILAKGKGTTPKEILLLYKDLGSAVASEMLLDMRIYIEIFNLISLFYRFMTRPLQDVPSSSALNKPIIGENHARWKI